jgi:hypothetical protein
MAIKMWIGFNHFFFCGHKKDVDAVLYAKRYMASGCPFVGSCFGSYFYKQPTLVAPHW